MTIKNEGSALKVGRLVKGSILERCGHLHEGDEILEVNDIDMRGKHIDDAARIIVSSLFL